MVQTLDKKLFDSYVKPKSGTVTKILREGILDREMDWYETPQPTGKRNIEGGRYIRSLIPKQKFDRICSERR